MMFHVPHGGLGPKLTRNAAWGEHCRKKASTFIDITFATAIAFCEFPVNATPLNERFKYLDALWRRWQTRLAFHAAYADRRSGVAEPDARTSF